MKKLTILFCVILALCITGCGQDGPGHTVTAKEQAAAQCKDHDGVNTFDTKYSEYTTARWVIGTCIDGTPYDEMYGGWAKDPVPTAKKVVVKTKTPPVVVTRNDVLN